MRSRLRTLGALALAATFVAAAPSAAQAADVTFVQPDGSKKSVDFSTVTPDVDSDYVVRGSTTGDKKITGVSVARLMQAADVTASFKAIEVVRGSGQLVRVTKSTVEQSIDPPVVFEADGNLNFLRPVVDGNDRNAPDIVSLTTLTINLDDSGFDELEVEATASAKTVKTGKPVSFSATASGDDAAEATFTWNFRDGASATGASAKHTFKKRGQYDVIVSAKRRGETRTDSAVVRIQVGAASKSKEKRDGAGENDAAGAPATGAAEGDSGSGDAAATTGATKNKPKTKRQSTPPEQSLPTVSGQLLSAATTPLPEESTLAARSGQQAAVFKSGSFALSQEAAIGILALMLALGGLLYELGFFAALRRHHRPV